MTRQTKYIRYERAGRIARITINRPQVLNALHPPAVQELDEIWSEFIEDPELFVAIFTGEGDRAFCAGADLKWRAEEGDERALRTPGSPHQKAIERCTKPIIAAVNGYAVGGGLELVLHCDIVVAAEHAKMGLPEVRRGLLADTGGLVKLPRRVPYHQAMAMILTGRFIDVAEAYRIGLVNEVVPMSDLLPAAERWANEIIECSPLAVQAAKDVVQRTLALAPENAAALLEALGSVRKLRDSQDYQEGTLAFAEKRKPVWKGR